VPGNLKHFTTPTFWEYYRQLPQEIQELADKNYELLKQDPKHPSLHFKKIRSLWSVRVLWFWIGLHSKYDDILKQI
jgi:hypothetical protein